MQLIRNHQPEPDFNFPQQQFKDSSHKKGVKQRYCSKDWFEGYNMLCYSRSTHGIFCLCCVLFPIPVHRGQKVKHLITTPYRKWKNARSDLAKQITNHYHHDSKTKMDDFMQIMSNPSQTIHNRLPLEAEKQIERNSIVLTFIIKCIEL